MIKSTSIAPRFKAAIIGVGSAAQQTFVKGGGHKIGYKHGSSLHRLEGVQVATAADINPENLAAFQREFDVPRVHSDYRVMLAEEKPDIVGVCTYMGLHARMVEDCIHAGVKIILCEKPFLASPAEMVRIARLVEEHPVTLGIAHMRRFVPNFIRARDLVAQGAVGDPVMIFGGLGGWDLAEFGSHWIDLIRFIHGDKPVSYTMGQARVRGQFGYGHRMEDHAIAYFEFEDGCRGLVDGGRDFAPPEGSSVSPRSGSDIRVVGTDGVLTITEGKGISLVNRDGRQWMDAPPEGPIDIWDLLYASLITQHEGGEESPVSFRRCAPSTEIYLAAYISALCGDRVELPFSGELAVFDRWALDAIAERNNL